VSLTIREIVIEPPLVLAPMAGFTDSVFRRLCRRHGAGLVVTELISSHAIHYRNEKTLAMLRWSEEERPISVQLFGAEPEIMAEAAARVAERGPDLIDINLGCSVPKVIKTGAGAALMKDPKLAGRVIRAVVEAVDIPVTVKMRRSWDAAGVPDAVEIAQAAVEAGAAAIAIHPRTARQGFSGEADWSVIRRVKEAVKVPVMGSGDVRDPLDARRMFEETGCDAVMIGRAALGNPWIFERTAHYLKTGELPPKPTLAERYDTAIEHVREMAKFWGEEKGVRDFRAHLGWYFRGFAGASRVREQGVRAASLDEIVRVLMAFREGAKETAIEASGQR